MTDNTTPLYMQCEMHTAQFDPERGCWTVTRTEGEDETHVEDVLDGARIVEISPMKAGADPNLPRRALVGVVSEGTEPKGFAIDYVDQTVVVADNDEPLDLYDFQMSAFRCDTEGQYVANFLDPLWSQAKQCAAVGAEAHVAEIHEGVETLRDIDDVYMQINWRLFDIALSGMTDGMTVEEVLAQAQFKNDAPIHQVHGLDSLVLTETIHYEAGYYDENGELVAEEDAEEFEAVYREAHDEVEVVFGLTDWHEIREYPQYMIDGVRAIFRNFMADRIGDTPIEGITRIQKAPGRVEDMCRLLDEGGFEYVGKSQPFADAARVMGRPYETSDVVTYKGNGLQLVVFDDFAGSYIYGWPDQPAYTAEKAAEPRI